jgi:hypothetical protein
MTSEREQKDSDSGQNVAIDKEQSLNAGSELSPSDGTGGNSKRSVRLLIKKVGALLALVLSLLYLFNSWHLQTRVAVELVVSRVVFSLRDGNEPVAIIPNATGFRALTIERFERVAFTPKQLEIFNVDPQGVASEWLIVSSKGELVLQGVGDNPANLSIEAIEANPETVAGRLAPISTRPASTVTAQVIHASPPAVTVKIDGQTLSSAVLPMGAFQLVAQQVDFKNISLPIAARDIAKFRVTLDAVNPYLEIADSARGHVFTITSAGGSPMPLLEKSGAAIKSIDFVAQKGNGELETTLAGPGQVIFPDYPKKKAVVLSEHDFIALADLSDAAITSLIFDNQKQTLFVKLEGTAGKISTKSGLLSTDHRATVLDKATNNAVLKAFELLILMIIGKLFFWHELLGMYRRFFS